MPPKPKTPVNQKRRRPAERNLIPVAPDSVVGKIGIAGKQKTRSPATLEQYRRIGRRVELEVFKEYQTDDGYQVTPSDIVQYFRNHVRNWSRETLRSNRQGILLTYFEGLEPGKAVHDAIAALEALGPDDCRKKPEYAARPKRTRVVKPDIKRAWELLAQQSDVRWTRIACSALLASVVTGIRPTEWNSVHQVDNINSLSLFRQPGPHTMYIETDVIPAICNRMAKLPSGRPCKAIIVQSIKNSNGMGHGKRRIIPLYWPEPVEAFLRHRDQFLAEGKTIAQFFNGIRNSIFYNRRKNPRIFPPKKSLYSGRHQFQADMKNIMSYELVCYLVGHLKNSDTTSRSYAGRAAGGKDFRLLRNQHDQQDLEEDSTQDDDGDQQKN